MAVWRPLPDNYLSASGLGSRWAVPNTLSGGVSPNHLGGSLFIAGAGGLSPRYRRGTDWVGLSRSKGISWAPPSILDTDNPYPQAEICVLWPAATYPSSHGFSSVPPVPGHNGYLSTHYEQVLCGSWPRPTLPSIPSFLATLGFFAGPRLMVRSGREPLETVCSSHAVGHGQVRKSGSLSGGRTSGSSLREGMV